MNIDVSTQKRTFPLNKRLRPSINVPMIASVHQGNKDPFPGAEEEDRHPNDRTMRMYACGAQPGHRFAWGGVEVPGESCTLGPPVVPALALPTADH